MEDPYLFRTATTADLELIIELDQTIFGSYGGDEDPEIIAARLETFPAGCAIMQHRDGAVVGYLTTEKWNEVREPTLNENPAETHKPSGTVLNITTLAIVPAFQNQQLGSRFLDYAEQFALAQGCRDMILETARAVRFYTRHGYNLVGERQQQGVDLFIMHKTLISNAPENGFVVIVKADCPTCQLIVPVLSQLVENNQALTIFSQDSLDFLSPIPTTANTLRLLDQTLEASFRLDIETVPTLIEVKNRTETNRIVGWQREAWEQFTEMKGLGAGLPAWRPGCGAKNVEPGTRERLALRFGSVKMDSRIITITDAEDEIEACYERGWSDGMPLVPPTKLRVYRMLEATKRRPDEILGHMPHNHAPVTVEKVAINAVMAGCKPEYFPVVLTAVLAACDPKYGLRAFMASTWFSAPVIVVNGPIAKQIGMASGFSAFGSGNRANATIGRALNLVVRNVGEVREGEVARSTMGNPGRYSFCFAENENGTSWLPLAVERGAAAGKSAVTLIAGDGMQPIADERSRTPHSLAISLATGLKAVYHHKWCLDADVILAVAPEHSRVFEQAGWSKARLRTELENLLELKTADLVQGANECAEGMPPEMVKQHPTLPKFLPGGIHIVRVGSNAGLFSAVISCWPTGGDNGTQPVTRVIEEV